MTNILPPAATPATNLAPGIVDAKAGAPLTWARMVELEPELVDLRIAARRRGAWREYGRLKRLLSRLVGWEAEQPELRSSAAYDVAHRHVLGGW